MHEECFSVKMHLTILNISARSVKPSEGFLIPANQGSAIPAEKEQLKGDLKKHLQKSFDYIYAKFITPNK
jgi:hypothetical protein